jgi:hypothetical protein
MARGCLEGLISNKSSFFLMPSFPSALVARVSAALTLVLHLSPACLACGGGGSGGYRKPVRPDHFNHQPATQGNASGSNPAPTATAPVQTNGF